MASFSLSLSQRGGEGHVHPQNLSAPSVSRSGGPGGRQPALSAEERHYQENIQRRDGSHTQTLPMYHGQTAGGKYTGTLFPKNISTVSLDGFSVSVIITALQDALVNLIRRARPVFLQCVHAKTDSGCFDVPALRVQLHSTQILSALQFHRTGQRIAPGSHWWDVTKYIYSSTNLRYLRRILNFLLDYFFLTYFTFC